MWKTELNKQKSQDGQRGMQFYSTWPKELVTVEKKLSQQKFRGYEENRAKK